MTENVLTVWQPENKEILPKTAKTSLQIIEYAAQLAKKDRKQIVAAFEAQHFEMGLNFLWGKTVTALKKELSTVGVSFLAEMLGRGDVDDDDDVEDILTTKDTILLAGELGVISATDAIRLRHIHEMVVHFSQLDSEESDSEEFEENEALASLKVCVKSVLGRPKVEVAKKFVEFRGALEGETLSLGDPRIITLKSSPYFFLKLTISVLMNGAKKNSGAQLEHILANINVIVPSIWSLLRDTEKWQVGYTYAEVYSDGKTTAFSGIKSALLKVKGFDYVPENLRSDTFIKAAEAILKAHEGMNNFYNEPPAVKNLAKLGSVIPTPAFSLCATALLSVVLGNEYGTSWAAQEEARNLLKKFTNDRWQYYFNHAFPSDIKILTKLSLDEPLQKWLKVIEDNELGELHIQNKTVASLINNSVDKNLSKIKRDQAKLVKEYYGSNEFSK